MFRLSPLSSTAYPLEISWTMARWQPRALGPGRGDFLSSCRAFFFEEWSDVGVRKFPY